MICGATTMGLIQPHFIPAAGDHGMPTTVAAGLLALVGLFDVAGTIASGWLTDRVDPRYLLLAYYVLRGFSLALLPLLFGPGVAPSMLAFIVFYGLDWVATIPPTMALCRRCSAPPRRSCSLDLRLAPVGAAIMALAAGSCATSWAPTTWPGTSGRVVPAGRWAVAAGQAGSGAGVAIP